MMVFIDDGKIFSILSHISWYLCEYNEADNISVIFIPNINNQQYFMQLKVNCSQCVAVKDH